MVGRARRAYRGAMSLLNRAARASIAQGLVAMAVSPLRTALCMLGVVMGIASVIATLALADGLERYARAQLDAQTDVQAISVESKTQETRDGFPFPTRRYPTFGPRDADELRRFLGPRAEVTLTVNGRAVVGSATAAPHAVSVTATLANYLAFGRRAVFAGRYFSDVESAHNAPVVVLSHKLAAELAPDGDPAAMVGRGVRVRGRALTTVGVMPPYLGETSFQIFVPVRAAAATLGVPRLTPSLLVRAPSLEAVDPTRATVVEWLATRYRDWDAQVSVTTSLARLEQARTAVLTLKLLLGALAGISLVVGGVGIMNVLLTSVTERTREIGVRKALGARRRDILLQFLAESVAIAGVGTGVGTLLGFAAAIGVAALVRASVPGALLHAAVTPATILTSIASAVTIGLAFGTLPALRAARLSPIDAIRHE
jgi:putative ABC transport system permease protein